MEFDPENYTMLQTYCIDNEIVKEYFWKVVSKDNSSISALSEANSLEECSSTSMTEGGYWITRIQHILSPKWLPDGGFRQVSPWQKYMVEELEGNLFYQPKGCRIKKLSDNFTCQHRDLDKM